MTLSLRQEVADNIRRFADQSEWGACVDEIIRIFDEIDKYEAFNLILAQLTDYEQIFIQSNSECEWIPLILRLLEMQASANDVEALLRWDEFENWDENAFFSSVEDMSRAYVSLSKGDYVKTKEKLIHATQAIMGAHRYHFWSNKYPHLVQFMSLDEDDSDGILARLSLGRDPIVNSFMRDRLYRIADEISR